MRASARGREASARMDQSTRVLREKRGRRRFGCIAFSGCSLRRKASQDAGLRGARLRPAGSGGAQFIGNCRTLRGGGFGPPGSESRNFKRGRAKTTFSGWTREGEPERFGLCDWADNRAFLRLFRRKCIEIGYLSPVRSLFRETLLSLCAQNGITIKYTITLWKTNCKS